MQIKQTDDAETGLVISYFGNQVAIETESGKEVSCHLRRNQPVPVVGDRVLFIQESDEAGVVKTILPRRALLQKADARGNMKGIAANVDLVVVVMSPPPVFSEYLIDRYMVAAHLLNITPLILVNKIDLLTEHTASTLNERLAVYRDADYTVCLSTTKQADGLSSLQSALSGKTAVLVGPSGVGKSSIIASLLNTSTIKIGEVSSKGAGKHTTTATRLYHLPCGGQIIESPGVREFNLWPIQLADVQAGFKEFQLYSSDCKFRDCLHLTEPHCAVQSAVSLGKIREQRYAMYQLLMKEMKK